LDQRIQIIGQIESTLRREFLPIKFNRDCIFLLAGSFSRGDIRLDNQRILSDLETVLIYNTNFDFDDFNSRVSKVNLMLKDFGIALEVDYVRYAAIIGKPVLMHVYEAIMSKVIIAGKLDVLVDISLDERSVKDVRIHRMFAQICRSKDDLVAFTDGCRKDATDLLSGMYLSLPDSHRCFVKTKKERLRVLENLIDDRTYSHYLKALNNRLDYREFVELMNQNRVSLVYGDTLMGQPFKVLPVLNRVYFNLSLPFFLFIHKRYLLALNNSSDYIQFRQRLSSLRAYKFLFRLFYNYLRKC